MNAQTDDLLIRHRLTVDEYYRMAETGLLAPDARVELIEGEIIDMAPIGCPHGGTVGLLAQRLPGAIGSRAVMWVQSSLRLNDFNSPQPDLMLLQPRADHYRFSHPTPADVLLLVEVSESSLRYDREFKAPLYAQHGVPEMWIVNLVQRELLCMRSPQAGGYEHTIISSAPAVLPISALDGTPVDLTGLFDY